ncbi:3-oxoadipyl-CoA thiolase [Methylobacterium sp. B1]|uniref:3-oxoadipyl-CoA thiolase n=1 Tax=Methylobacterium sp. B1 TaxID=91459 RepID=UPI000349413E|nr:3-oxoadipyl-CoA thiolase [Methylobacterium sp. B1]
MIDAYICDAVRTPVGRYGGALSSIRADDLGAIPLLALQARSPSLDWRLVDDVVFGCANQAGEDNRNVARMSSLLAGLEPSIPGVTVNRLCGSGMDAVAVAARAIRTGEADMMIAGGVESMSRAPFVMAKAESPFSRSVEIHDTTIGWRFVNARMKARYGVDSMPETAENVATDFNVSRADQDRFAFLSQQRYADAAKRGAFDREIVPVPIKAKRRGDSDTLVEKDEHPRETTLEALARLPTPFRADGTITAGNASGVNDGAAAILLTSAAIAKRFGLSPLARVVAAATAGVEPRIMGFGPAPSVQKLLRKCDLAINDISVIEINEAFAAQVLAVLHELGLDDDDGRVNANGGAIAIGHPLGMSGARLIGTAAYRLQAENGRFALCTMCIGVGQGISMLLERA